eukprot:4669903-Amphidinium_carterae.1
MYILTQCIVIRSEQQCSKLAYFLFAWGSMAQHASKFWALGPNLPCWDFYSQFLYMVNDFCKKLRFPNGAIVWEICGIIIRGSCIAVQIDMITKHSLLQH